MQDAMNTEIIPFVAILGILSIMLSGCLSPNISSNTMTADEILSNMFNATEGVSSYKYSALVNSTISLVNESGINETTTIGIQNGTIDNNNKKLKQDNSAISSKVNGTQHWVIYLENTILYSGYEIGGMMRWSSQNTSHENPITYWDTYSVIGGFKMLLNQSFRDSFDIFTLERVSDETVNDINCYVLLLNATSNKTNENVNGYHYGNMSTNIEDTFWIAKQTKYLIKAEINSLTDANGAYTVGWPITLRSSITGKMTIDFNDYNEPVTIVVPSEAKNHW